MTLADCTAALDNIRFLACGVIIFGTLCALALMRDVHDSIKNPDHQDKERP